MEFDVDVFFGKGLLQNDGKVFASGAVLLLVLCIVILE